MSEIRTGWIPPVLNRKPRVLSLTVLLPSFLLGSAFSVVVLHFGWIRWSLFPLWLIKASTGNNTVSLFFRLLEYSFPFLVLLFLSSSTVGCFFLPIEFFCFGAFVGWRCVDIFLLAGRDGFPAFLSCVPVFLLCPALFLLGEIGFQRAGILRSFSHSGTAVSVPSIPGERLAISFGLVWAAAFLQQFMIPLIL